MNRSFEAVDTDDEFILIEETIASDHIQALGNGSLKRRKALSDISQKTNTPTKPIDFTSTKVTVYVI